MSGKIDMLRSSRALRTARFYWGSRKSKVQVSTCVQATYAAKFVVKCLQVLPQFYEEYTIIFWDVKNSGHCEVVVNRADISLAEFPFEWDTVVDSRVWPFCEAHESEFAWFELFYDWEEVSALVVRTSELLWCEKHQGWPVHR